MQEIQCVPIHRSMFIQWRHVLRQWEQACICVCMILYVPSFSLRLQDHLDPPRIAIWTWHLRIVPGSKSLAHQFRTSARQRRNLVFSTLGWVRCWGFSENIYVPTTHGFSEKPGRMAVRATLGQWSCQDCLKECQTGKLDMNVWTTYMKRRPLDIKRPQASYYLWQIDVNWCRLFLWHFVVLHIVHIFQLSHSSPSRRVHDVFSGSSESHSALAVVRLHAPRTSMLFLLRFPSCFQFVSRVRRFSESSELAFFWLEINFWSLLSLLIYMKLDAYSRLIYTF